MTTGLTERTRVATVIPIALPDGAVIPVESEGTIIASYGNGIVYELEFPGDPPVQVHAAAEIVRPIEEIENHA